MSCCGAPGPTEECPAEMFACLREVRQASAGLLSARGCAALAAAGVAGLSALPCQSLAAAELRGACLCFVNK